MKAKLGATALPKTERSDDAHERLPLSTREERPPSPESAKAGTLETPPKLGRILLTEVLASVREKTFDLARPTVGKVTVGLLAMAVPAGLIFPYTTTHSYVGLARSVDPKMACEYRPNVPVTPAKIDAMLDDRSIYTGKPERTLWEFRESWGGAFSGKQSLEGADPKPMSISGFLRAGTIVASIAGKHGYGTFFLQSRGNEDLWRGYSVALDCALPVDTVIVCPVVIGEASKVSEADPFLKNHLCQRWDRMTEGLVLPGS